MSKKQIIKLVTDEYGAKLLKLLISTKVTKLCKTISVEKDELKKVTMSLNLNYYGSWFNQIKTEE